MIAGAALAFGATLPAEANEQEPYRVRGTLESVESDKLTVNTREGEALDLTLNDASRLRGTAEGHGPWDLVKEPNTMTNATVAEIEEVGDQRELKVRYKQGEGEAARQSTYPTTCRS